MAKLYFSKKELKDEDLRDLPALSNDGRDCVHVDFSQNALTSLGLATVLDLCNCPYVSNLRVLKFHKNMLCDLGADALAASFTVHHALEELHLSHNRITGKGAMSLVEAASKNRLPGMTPLWLRLEHNLIQNPQELLCEMKQSFSVCEGENAALCKARTCVNDCKVHLPYFWQQDAGKDAAHARQGEGVPDASALGGTTKQDVSVHENENSRTACAPGSPRRAFMSRPNRSRSHSHDRSRAHAENVPTPPPPLYKSRRRLSCRHSTPPPPGDSRSRRNSTPPPPADSRSTSRNDGGYSRHRRGYSRNDSRSDRGDRNHRHGRVSWRSRSGNGQSQRRRRRTHQTRKQDAELSKTARHAKRSRSPAKNVEHGYGAYKSGKINLIGRLLRDSASTKDGVRKMPQGLHSSRTKQENAIMIDDSGDEEEFSASPMSDPGSPILTLELSPGKPLSNDCISAGKEETDKLSGVAGGSEPEAEPSSTRAEDFAEYALRLAQAFSDADNAA